jgi:hypothetical protein
MVLDIAVKPIALPDPPIVRPTGDEASSTTGKADCTKRVQKTLYGIYVIIKVEDWQQQRIPSSTLQIASVSIYCYYSPSMPL